ncbi:MAG: zinc-binding dehydrogenase [Dehalococcoidia bacterium]
MADDHVRGLQLRSTVNSDGTLDVRLVTAETPPPGADEVVVRVDAAPINPSDLGLMLAGADPATAEQAGTPAEPVIRAPLPPAAVRAAAARAGQSLPVGNEGAGTVVAAGSDPEAQALTGKTVAIVGGGMYTQYRTMRAKECLLLPEGTTAEEGAACFVNPLTVLGMVETMRLEGHTALVHTAAASNLGQMLVKLCLAEGIELVNIVRREEHVDLLRSLGAKHICNSSAGGFMESLVDALAETGATIAFDATGGGELASRILTAMEAAAVRTMTEFSRYGSTVHKQVYIYGGLDRSPTVLTRNYGTFWSLGGWLLTPFLERVGPEAADRLRRRVAAEVKTTFASHYTAEVSLREALNLETLKAYARMATGEKYLIRPNQ